MIAISKVYAQLDAHAAAIHSGQPHTFQNPYRAGEWGWHWYNTKLVNLISKLEIERLEKAL